MTEKIAATFVTRASPPATALGPYQQLVKLPRLKIYGRGAKGLSLVQLLANSKAAARLELHKLAQSGLI